MAKPAPPTSCVGESGVRSSGCSSSSACSSRSSLSNSRVGDDRRVPHVVAELVLAHLVGEFLPAAAQVGVRERRRPARPAPSRDPGLPSGSPSQANRAADDTKTPAATLAACRTRSCSATTTSGWRKCARSPGLPGGVREDLLGQAGVLRAEDVRHVRRQRQDRHEGRVPPVPALDPGQGRRERPQGTRAGHSVLLPRLHGPVGLARAGLHGDARRSTGTRCASWSTRRSG